MVEFDSESFMQKCLIVLEHMGGSLGSVICLELLRVNIRGSQIFKFISGNSYIANLASRADLIWTGI